MDWNKNKINKKTIINYLKNLDNPDVVDIVSDSFDNIFDAVDFIELFIDKHYPGKIYFRKYKIEK